MPLSMWIKIEISAVLLGLLGVAITLLELAYWSDLPEYVHEIFRGGGPGAFVVGLFLLAALLGSLLFLVNLGFKRFAFWWLRLLGIIIFFTGMVIVGASGI
ncbi:hypothetical protein [Microbulbifer sp. MCCC 1A16149]|uniref:hypothetical protein n=1 Tax=Microbulbifer sp. MCCC 1A16149 TaxID=3411322 RepID=UPI003D13E59F